MKKYKLGFTAGNFDLLHPGYIITFEEAKRHCDKFIICLLYTSPSPRDRTRSRMPSSA